MDYKRSRKHQKNGVKKEEKVSDLLLENTIAENSKFRAIKSQHMAKRRNLDQFVGV